MKIFSMLGVIAIAAAACGAEPNQYVGGKVELNNGIRVIVGSGARISSPALEINPAKVYQISGKFKASQPGSGWVCFGLVPYDAGKQQIIPAYVNVVPGSDTTLAAEAKAGDRQITVKDASRWKNAPHRYVAFNTKADLSDLPNRGIIEIASIEGNVVRLKSPLAASKAAGAAVRQHKSGDFYIYTAAAYAPVAADKWTEFNGRISDVKPFGLSRDTFWKGTRYVAVVIVTNLQNVQFKDIDLDEID